MTFRMLFLLALAGCASPTHLQYDHGRAFYATLDIQSDLSRPSAANADYPLSGVEAAAIRARVTEDTTDTEKVEPPQANE